MRVIYVYFNNPTKKNVRRIQIRSGGFFEDFAFPRLKRVNSP